jgi:two-component system, sensor histidine kinase and response regulator
MNEQQGVTVDITERKVAEEALRASEARFRALVQNSTDMITVLDAEGTVVYQSPSIERLLGYRADDRTGHNVFSDPIVHPDDLEVKRAFFDSARGLPGTPVKGEFRLRHADGSWRDIEAVGQNFLHDPAVAGIVANYRDITERKRTEEELRRTTALLQGFVDGTQDAVYVKDCEGRHLLFNAAASRMVGKPIEAVIGRDDTAIFDPDSARDVMAHDRQVMESGVATTKEHELSAAGVTRTYLSSKAPYRDGRGNVIGLIGLCHDITDRKRVEEALRQANDRLDLAVRGSNLSIWECDMPDGRIENSHPTLINVWELLGYETRTSPRDFPSTFALLFHPDDQERVGRELQELFAGEGQEYESAYRVRPEDGSTRWHLARGKVLRDPKGKPVRFIGTSADITDLKRAEEALRASERRFRAIVDHAADAFFLSDEQGRLLDVNRQACESLGYSRDELLTMTPFDFVPELTPNAVEDRIRHLLAGETIGFESRHRRKDGTVFPVEVRGKAFWEAGRGFFVFLTRDVTDRKRAEEELRRAKEAAEAANRAKDDFLANVSHEIRTPMNAIIGMTELVLDTALEEDQRQGLKTAKSAADSLLGIINDLLDFSKIEAGKLELVLADFSLRAAVGDTLRALAVRAHRKGLELIYQVQPDVPDALIGDAGRLRQVLLNLAGNAVKFTDEGEVVVRVGLDKETGRQGDKEEEESDGSVSLSPGLPVSLSFEVRDTGIGIPSDQQERIFHAFEQEDTSTTRKYGGTGLGLTIAARLVALMGGQISVDSAPGRGSTFAFTARFSRPPHPPEPGPAPPPLSLHDLPVLVVDDNATNRHILAEWLRGWQMDPTAVDDGMAAMDALWHRAANGRPYALVLLDARMPDADGLAVAAMIRERAELAATRIILLTSGERPGDPARVRELRIGAQLLKPVQQDELLETIYRVMSRSQGNAPPLARPTPRQQASTARVPAATPLNILVAEDNELSAQVLEQALVRQGHRVRLVSNGREVLTLAEQGGFDLLLLDVHMPELDGFQVVQAVRERELTAGGHLPIIALTARSRKQDRERCLAAGMDDFQTKPIRPADLLAAIDGVLRTHSSRQSRRRDLLDAPVLLAACGGDPTLLRKMCQTLTARVPEHLAALREALRDQDAPHLREAAHKCCGMLSEFSAAAGDLAGRLEDLAAGTQLEEAAPILEQLETIALELVTQIDGITVEALRRQAEVTDEPGGTPPPLDTGP